MIIYIDFCYQFWIPFFFFSCVMPFVISLASCKLWHFLLHVLWVVIFSFNCLSSTDGSFLFSCSLTDLNHIEFSHFCIYKYLIHQISLKTRQLVHVTFSQRHLVFQAETPVVCIYSVFCAVLNSLSICALALCVCYIIFPALIVMPYFSP